MSLLETLQARFVLDIDLQDPGGIVLFGDGIGQCGLDGIAQLRHECRGARLGTGRGQLEQGTDTDPVLQQKGAALRVVLHPGQQIGKGRRAFIQRLDLSRGDRCVFQIDLLFLGR